MAANIRVGIDSKDARSGAKEIEGAFDDIKNHAKSMLSGMEVAGKGIVGAFDRIKSATKGLIAGLGNVLSNIFSLQGAVAALVSGAAIKGFFDFVERTDRLYDLGSALGFTGKQIGTLSLLAVEAHTSVETLSDQFQDLAERVDEFQKLGSGGGVDAFKALGLSADQLAHTNGGLFETFSLIAEKLSQVTDANEQARIANILFAGSAQDMLPILKKGAEGIKELQSRADEFGVGLNKNQQAAIDSLNRSVSGFLQRIGGLLLQTTAAVSPGIESFLNAVDGKLKDFIDKQGGPGGFANWLVVSMLNGFEQILIGLESFRVQMVTTFESLVRTISSLTGSDLKVFSSLEEKMKAIEEYRKSIVPDWSRQTSGLSRLISDMFAGTEEGLAKLQKGLVLDGAESRIDAIKAMFEEMKYQVQAVNGEVEVLNTTIQEPRPNNFKTDGAGAYPNEDPEVMLFFERQTALNNWADQFTQSTMNEENLLADSLGRRSQMINDAEDHKILTAERSAELRRAIEEKYHRDVEKLNGKMIANIGSTFTNIASIYKDESASAFENFKALASAEAIMNTIVGATMALREGGVYGIVQMVSVLAAGAAQVAQIQSMSYNQGSSAALTPSSSTTQLPPQSTLNPTIGGDNSGRVVNIYVNGYHSEDLPSIIEEAFNNDQVIIREGTKQYQTLTRGAA